MPFNAVLCYAMLCMLCSIIIDAICLTRHDQNRDQDQPSGRCSPDQNECIIQWIGVGWHGWVRQAKAKQKSESQEIQIGCTFLLRDRQTVTDVAITAIDGRTSGGKFIFRHASLSQAAG
jgi:hypothetical protein